MKSMVPTLGKLLYDDSNTESARFYKSSTKKKLIASEAFMVGVWLFLLYCWWSQCNNVSACLSNLLDVLLLISICAFIILGIVTLLLRYWGAIAPMQIFENALVLGKDKEEYYFSDLEVIYWNPLFEYTIILPKKDIKLRPFIIDKDLIYKKDKFKSVLRERVHFDEEKDFTVKEALREKKRKKNQKDKSY